jgi:hypothetical protein
MSADCERLRLGWQITALKAERAQERLHCRNSLTVAVKSTTTPLPPKLLALSFMIEDHCAAS